jgi:hypothetical protein
VEVMRKSYSKGFKFSKVDDDMRPDNTRDLGASIPVPSRSDAFQEGGEEFYVVWTGADISLVKFEYRQVRLPEKIFALSYVPTARRSHVFEVAGNDFRKGGKVSAWRVTLWRGATMIAEKQSALW